MKAGLVFVGHLGSVTGDPGTVKGLLVGRSLTFLLLNWVHSWWRSPERSTSSGHQFSPRSWWYSTESGCGAGMSVNAGISAASPSIITRIEKITPFSLSFVAGARDSLSQ